MSTNTRRIGQPAQESHKRDTGQCTGDDGPIILVTLACRLSLQAFRAAACQRPVMAVACQGEGKEALHVGCLASRVARACPAILVTRCTVASALCVFLACARRVPMLWERFAGTMRTVSGRDSLHHRRGANRDMQIVLAARDRRISPPRAVIRQIPPEKPPPHARPPWHGPMTALLSAGCRLPLQW